MDEVLMAKAKRKAGHQGQYGISRKSVKPDTTYYSAIK
jgi:hypothetical protein